MGKEKGEGRGTKEPPRWFMIAVFWRGAGGGAGTHLHAVEGSDTHVEEDAVEHRHGNELQGEEQEKLSPQTPQT